MREIKTLVLAVAFLATAVSACAPNVERQAQPQSISDTEELQPQPLTRGDIAEPQPQLVSATGEPQPIPPAESGEYDPPTETGQAPPLESGNVVTVRFSEEFIHIVSGDTFVNRPVTGKTRWRALQPINDLDETRAPVFGLMLTLDYDLPSVGGVSDEKRTKTGPPTYEWTLGDLLEGPPTGWYWDAFVESAASPTTFTPGIDVTRSIDRTVFSATGIQTVTIRLVPREDWIREVSVFVHTYEDLLMDPVILSLSASVEGSVELTPDGHRSDVEYLSLEVGTPLILTYTIQVTPKALLPVVHSPYTAVDVQGAGRPSSGTARGSSVSHTSEMGTWTFSAEGDYIWRWFTGEPSYSLVFPKSDFNDWVILLAITVLLVLTTSGAFLVAKKRRRKARER